MDLFIERQSVVIILFTIGLVITIIITVAIFTVIITVKFIDFAVMPHLNLQNFKYYFHGPEGDYIYYLHPKIH